MRETSIPKKAIVQNSPTSELSFEVKEKTPIQAIAARRQKMFRTAAPYTVRIVISQRTMKMRSVARVSPTVYIATKEMFAPISMCMIPPFEPVGYNVD
jgi:hypothetical protein